MANNVKKYRLGNQPEEYELSEDYLGWIPKGEGWMDLYFRSAKNEKLMIASPDGKGEKKLFLHHIVIKDAFPLSFFGEERAKNWSHFAVVSDDETSEKFIVPMH